ncbi:dATP/dGTP diphosphohydrolase domain-containing protein [Selenomonas bovis]|uniref:dATP/dGTP diphosphohydrolase domain-containing protein n=1 Tax=Selenomonas bovis TaxID=416586 RepID=UPI00037BEC1A|nr:dATP/dGTP diphosphohydrolase domain-containing protein [Selenomonas bovis]
MKPDEYKAARMGEKEKQMITKYKWALYYAACDYSMTKTDCSKCNCRDSCKHNPGTMGCRFALEDKWKRDAGIKDNQCAKDHQRADAAPAYPQDTEEDEYRYIDANWLEAVARGLTAGAKKHPGETWRQIPPEEHAARAMRHLNLYRAGNRKDTHLINAAMRCMMAYVTEKARGEGRA